eukprot:CAMPEP_0170895846 /NCGR_PEP_ID=MMETSP0734-20130129/44340_1 /TAXON_ID=186038 /ORGANISM="Fragilariopsis kerguelensis, Strain L26-C5" /LENGTH=54 /DNA_ID=CAMNT_0011287771 /DNA_START=81 /DNA_END=242 /DNA_ORIENTATION=-
MVRIPHSSINGVITSPPSRRAILASIGREPGSVVSATQNPKIPNTARVPKLFVL